MIFSTIVASIFITLGAQSNVIEQYASPRWQIPSDWYGHETYYGWTAADLTGCIDSDDRGNLAFSLDFQEYEQEENVCADFQAIMTR